MMMLRSMASSNTSPKGIAAVVGVGPKLGLSIARKFAHEGYTVAILARDLTRLSRFAEEIARQEKAQVFAIRIDCSESRSIKEAFEAVLSLGFVEVLVYNSCPSLLNHHQQQQQPINFTNIDIKSFEKNLAVYTVGALHCSQQVIPGMVERGKGTILFTGCSASLTGIAGFSELSCGKFALRGLSQCMAREFQPLGIHVAHIIINGVISLPLRSSSSSSSMQYQNQNQNQNQQQQRSLVGSNDQEQGMSSKLEVRWLDPDALAQTYWHLHVQDPSAWTQEIDLH